MRSIRQLSPNQGALWTIYELVSAQALRPSLPTQPISRGGYAVTRGAGRRLVFAVRRLVAYVRSQVQALLSEASAQGSRVSAVT
jgi:hypothetical protein